MFLFSYVSKVPAIDILLDTLRNIQIKCGANMESIIESEDKFSYTLSKNSAKELLENADKTSCLAICRALTNVWEKEQYSALCAPLSYNFCSFGCGEVVNALDITERFETSTPSQDGLSIIPFLLERQEQSSTLSAIKTVSAHLYGNYSYIATKKGPNVIYAVNQGITLYVGIGTLGSFASNDIWSLSHLCDKVFAVDYGETAVASNDKVMIYDKRMRKQKRTPRRFNLSLDDPLGTSNRFKKEIYACPSSIENTISTFMDNSKVSFKSLKIHFSSIKQVYFVGDSSCYPLALAAKSNFESISDIPSYAFTSGEYCCSNAITDRNTLFVTISQSGETNNTIKALLIANKNNAKTLAITNTPFSTVSRIAKHTLFTSTGYESAKINTKFFSCAFTILSYLSIYIGRKNSAITELYANVAIKNAAVLADKIRLVLKSENEVAILGARIKSRQKVILVGQNVDYSTALDGARTIRKITGIDSRAVRTGSLTEYEDIIDNKTAIIALVSSKEFLYENACEIKKIHSLGASLYLVIAASIDFSNDIFDYVLRYDDTIPLLNPIIENSVINLLSYSIGEKDYQIPLEA